MKSPAQIDSKSLLRNKLKRRIALISAAQRRRKSQSVCKGLLQSDFVQEARSVLVYAARRDELDTWPLIRKLLADRKKAVYLPRIEGTHIGLYRVKSLKRDLQLGAYGILEPRKNRNRLGKIEQIDMAIIPGLGFTPEGVRLGRGAGYFDRLLARAKNVIKIGVAYRQQVVAKIPSLKHDVRMNFVITD